MSIGVAQMNPTGINATNISFTRPNGVLQIRRMLNQRLLMAKKSCVQTVRLDVFGETEPGGPRLLDQSPFRRNCL